MPRPGPGQPPATSPGASGAAGGGGGAPPHTAPAGVPSTGPPEALQAGVGRRAAARASSDASEASNLLAQGAAAAAAELQRARARAAVAVGPRGGDPPAAHLLFRRELAIEVPADQASWGFF